MIFVLGKNKHNKLRFTTYYFKNEYHRHDFAFYLCKEKVTVYYVVFG